MTRPRDQNATPSDPSQAMDECLAVANDASSALNLAAFYAMQKLTGYPGQIGDYDQCAKVRLMCAAQGTIVPRRPISKPRLSHVHDPLVSCRDYALLSS